MTQRQTRSAALWVAHGAPRWLTAAADRPADCRRGWITEPAKPSMLATGKTFDAVVVADELGLRTLDGYRRITAPALPTVIDHRARKIAFLIAPCGADFFAETLTSLRGPVAYRYLGRGDYLVVPGPVPEVGARHQWLAPPRPAPDLSAGAIVMLAGHLVAESRRLSKVRAGHQGADRDE